MSTKESRDWIHIGPERHLEVHYGILNELLEIEGGLYRNDFESACKIHGIPLTHFPDQRLSAELLAVHKLLFLTGGDQGDIITAEDAWGNFVYTKLRDDLAEKRHLSEFRDLHPVKEGEIQEALSSISFFIQKSLNLKAPRSGDEYRSFVRESLLGPYDLPEVLSEVADIAFNLANLDHLEARQYNYRRDISALCRSLGYTESQLLYVVNIKYSDRYDLHDGEKDIERENTKIGKLLRDGDLPIPSLGQLSLAYGEINLIHHTIIRPRLFQLKTHIDRKTVDPIPSTGLA